MTIGLLKETDVLPASKVAPLIVNVEVAPMGEEPLTTKMPLFEMVVPEEIIFVLFSV